MSIHPLHLLHGGERTPLITEESGQTVKQDGRIWKWLKSAFRVSRRYSVVASEVALLALNTILLVAKADKDAPVMLGEVTLALLSTVGVLSLHYYIDVVWKSSQDMVFAARHKNIPIMLLAGAKTVQVANNVALTAGNFVAAMQGVTGHVAAQSLTYRRMIVWGEVSLATGLGVTLLSLLTTWIAKRKVAQGEIERDPRAVAFVRYAMDKDTLWHLIDKLKRMDPNNVEELGPLIKIIQNNIDTQIKVTTGGQIVLILAGDVLQAIEKAYTPNSLVSAIINCGVSLAYAAKFSIEKCIEHSQRKKIDEMEDESDDRELLSTVDV